MIAEQARELGVRTVCLDPAADAPAFNVCDDHIVAAYDDAAALEELCRRSDAVTYEFENVPGDILIPLCGKYNIPQGYKPLYDSQDRLREKSNARDHGLRTPGFEAVDDEASLREAVRRLGLPAVLKTRTLGYDGHGQRVLKTEADIAGALPLLCLLYTSILGSFSFKGTTREARFGNPTPRIAECGAGMINAVGLQNPGIDAVIREELPRLKTFFRKPVIANISGFSVEEYAYCCERIDRQEQVGLIEVNVSCPNVRHGGMSFGTLSLIHIWRPLFHCFINTWC